MTRRELLAAAAGSALAPEAQRWTARWDRAVLEAARGAARRTARELLEHALVLLELSGERNTEEALAAIDHVAGLEDTGAGTPLLVIEFRHGQRIPARLRQRMRVAIQQAAEAARRESKPEDSASAATEFAFVTLGAGQLLGDDDLSAYGLSRLRRFASRVDETGSFAEYNSSTSAYLTIANLTRIRMFVKDEAAAALAGAIHHRLWLHLARHWHSPTNQLAGPMSHCDLNGIGRPAWLQKALDGELLFLDWNEIPGAGVPGEVGILDYRCPDDLSGFFLSFGASTQRRELFRIAPPGTRPVQGTTWLDRYFCLGSVNRGDFSSASRPLLAYWGGPERPERYLRARVLKDDSDFPSALLYCVQERSFVLGVVNLRYPEAGKKESFACSRLRLRFDLAGVPVNAPVLVNAEPVDGGEFPAGSRVAVDVGGVWMWLRALSAQCGEPAGRVAVTREDGLLTISVDLLNTRQAQLIRWSERAYAAFALAMQDPAGVAASDVEAYDRQWMQYAVKGQAATDDLRILWDTPAGVLGLTARMRPGEIAELDRAFWETLNGVPIPVVRLSDEKLA